jgi:hypothetical protein
MRRARLTTVDGKPAEWKSQALRAYQQRTLAADTLIASTYLADTNTRPMRRALSGFVRRDGRQGRGEPDVAQGEKRLGCLEHPFAGRGADRAPGPGRHSGARAARPQGDLDPLLTFAIKSMRGESAGLGALCWTISSGAGCGGPSPLIVDGAPGLDKAIASVRDRVPIQRCTIHKHRNLFAHAAERLHDEITADYNDMIYATTSEEIEVRRKAFIRKWGSSIAPLPTACGGGRRALVHLHVPTTGFQSRPGRHPTAVQERLQGRTGTSRSAKNYKKRVGEWQTKIRTLPFCSISICSISHRTSAKRARKKW